MNKGEHSEILYSLWLLKEGKTLLFDDKQISYIDSHLTISELDKKIATTSIPFDLDDVIRNATSEIKNSQGVFESKNLQPIYSFYHSNNIPVKANNKNKADVFILSSPKVGISIKSFLGSNPSILNANHHFSGIEYTLPKKYSGYEGRKISTLPESILDEAKFAKYSNSDFASYVKNFKELPNIVLTWKKTKQANLSSLLPNNQESEPEGLQDFLNFLIGGKQKEKTSLFGIVHKDGTFTLEEINNFWEYLYFDSPSRKRHDYGYIYLENGQVYLRIVLGIRMKENYKKYLSK